VTFNRLDDVVAQQKEIIRQEIHREYDELLNIRLKEEKVVMARRLREEIE
jgi:hypothetical protein